MVPAVRSKSGVLAFSVLLLTSYLLIAAPPAYARTCAFFDFAKNSTNQTNSVLQFKQVDRFGGCTLITTVRAGSGTTTDSCQKDFGWLPNGWYDMLSTGMTDNYAGTLIHGRVWSLQDKACAANGTIRTQLFIHTEENVDNTQTCTSATDDPWCWDSTKADPTASVATHDYFSAGCIKVRRKSPEGSWADDMTLLHAAYHNSLPGHGTSLTNMVYVHN